MQSTITLSIGITMQPSSWFQAPPKALDQHTQHIAQQRQLKLTKPPGSLGRLESLAITLAAMQGNPQPTLNKVGIVIFAADHGVAAHGVSAFPQAVTVEMIRNFSRGGAAITVLARQLAAQLTVVDVGALSDVGPLPGVISRRCGAGTADFRSQPAMQPTTLAQAMAAGCEQIEQLHHSGGNLFIGGEMGIGNTTSASALLCAYAHIEPQQAVGPGTGVDAAGLQRKIAALQSALAFHQGVLHDPLATLQCLGGFEIAALTGAYIRAAQLGMPVLVDGFICSAAALAAQRLCPGVEGWFFLAHHSAEPAHAILCRMLGKEPLLNLGMRLGEGSGAAMAVPLLRMACALHNEMATFAQAGVSGGA
ncbi:Nicotinate-nucleotide--dimethylbenzimidazole phosphoribosyltransferase [Magnetococcus marinus MC-1]|uniref:Nicotinate-nucleotide--dimethylbenzimidazole phosphoribosyltransferase n=1 Tax=Magnetococcus marinus (strain ATCC BAA-1437 / JCM 17883 / MC-1) TaxID=156889 RepID=A0LCS6_MAGMM|nr:nicotinate-nucleotide--dimethylbenzimidazole phosphoribosyltransferase [Magnetococcus marinus]ABK45769.1 Nicotinate-nucleotide--dimethylbenzimidazole phosphoribosyltransferase [Magnetococcus marinus MC-1]